MENNDNDNILENKNINEEVETIIIESNTDKQPQKKKTKIIKENEAKNIEENETKNIEENDTIVLNEIFDIDDNSNNEEEKINENSNSNNIIQKENENLIIKSEVISEKIENEEEESLKHKYDLEIKKYINADEQNKDYMNIIKNEPEKLFELINDRTIMLWESKIYSFEMIIINDDVDILTAAPERKDQHIIINDSNRTRFKECDLVPGFKKILEEILTFYCNTKKIMYKQGLNEIFGPLILMKYKMNNLKLTKIFNLGDAFIDKFLPDYFYEKELELYSLRSSISLFVHLLKYHEPSVFNYLDSIEIPHELYATSWLLTLRAQKLHLDILYNLWDNLIKVDDPLFIHFILVALIKYKRELLISCDSNLLLKLMVGLTITSKDELEEIIKIALQLRSNTPYSYRLLANKIGFLKINNKKIKNNFDKYKPEITLSNRIFPIELLYLNYNDKIECPDPKCPNHLNKNQNGRNIEISNFEKNFIYKKNCYTCEKCNMKIEKKLNYIILDLRLFLPSYFKEDDDYFKMGFISGMMIIDKDELKLENIDTLLSSRLWLKKGESHIILMTSSTDYFSDFEQKYYSDNRSEVTKKKILFGVIEQQKVEKKLNLKEAEKNLDLKEIYKLKEYDNLRKIMITMKRNNYPYVSYLEGGFEALHRQSLYYNIELVNHNRKECKLCNNIIKETQEEKEYKNLNIEDKIAYISNSLWKNIKTITENELKSFFSDENNIVLVCNLIKYKNKYFHKNTIEIYVAILFDKKIIEIYKNDFKLEKTNSKYNIDNINYYNLGLKVEQKKVNFTLRLFEYIQFNDIIKITLNNELNNIISLYAKNKEIEKKKINLDNTVEIRFAFLSTQDSQTFKNALKTILKNNKNPK